MAEYNVRINVKNSTGYDQLYPESKSDIVNFDKTSSNLTSTNVEAAIKEVNTKANTNKTNIGTLSSLTTDSKTNLVGAINEVNSHADTAQSTATTANNTANTNKTNIGTLSSLKTSIKTSIVNAINSLYDSVVHKTSVIDNLDDIIANQSNGMVAGAKAVKELNNKFLSQNVLWEGSFFMQASQTVNLSEKISDQKNGIIIEFSRYQSGGTVLDYGWNYCVIPKIAVSMHGGAGFSCLMSTTGAVLAVKYLYIYDSKISGHSTNTESPSNLYVMRKVIGF